MIHNQDRSGWFGASDTSMVMGNWSTASFARWWLVKLGVGKQGYTSRAMQTGTALEHRILAHMGVTRMDRQIKVRRLRLRVNLDGETRTRIKEVKTYSGARFVLSKAYWQQAQVEAYAGKKPVDIVAYHVTIEDYRNWFLPIEDARLETHAVQYDSAWIDAVYLPRLRYLAQCLREGVWPDAGRFSKI